MRLLLFLVWPVVGSMLTPSRCANAAIFGNASEPECSEKQKVANTTATKCCWCRFKSTGDSEVATYFGKATCENKGASRFAACRSVDVAGNSCSFISISHRDGGTQCTAHSLVFLDGENDRVINPPPWAVASCKSGSREKNPSSAEATLAAALPQIDGDPGEESPAAGSASGNGNDALPPLEMDADGHYTSYWTCGRDSSDAGKCKARYVENGVDVVTESKELGNEKTCSPSFCDKNFSEKFSSLSRVFEPSEP